MTVYICLIKALISAWRRFRILVKLDPKRREASLSLAARLPSPMQTGASTSDLNASVDCI